MSKYPDISHYHPVTNWATVRGQVGFLISKATQGTSFIDSTLDSFIKGCEAQKIPYWLFTYLNKGSEKAQAEFLIKTCKDKVGSHFVGYILDVEAENAAADVKAALTYLNSVGVKTMIYTMYAQYETYKAVISARGSSCAWWEARYGLNNGSYSSKYPCHSGADLHQYTDKGTCSGIGTCDLNRLTGTKAESWFTTPLSATSSTASKASAAPSYKVGTVYTVQADHLAVRTGAGTGNAKVPYSKLTANGKENAYSDGCLKKGTRVTCSALKTEGSDIWMQIPSGWIAAYYGGDVFVK